MNRDSLQRIIEHREGEILGYRIAAVWDRGTIDGIKHRHDACVTGLCWPDDGEPLYAKQEAVELAKKLAGATVGRLSSIRVEAVRYGKSDEYSDDAIDIK